MARGGTITRIPFGQPDRSNNPVTSATSACSRSLMGGGPLLTTPRQPGDRAGHRGISLVVGTRPSTPPAGRGDLGVFGRLASPAADGWLRHHRHVPADGCNDPGDLGRWGPRQHVNVIVGMIVG